LFEIGKNILIQQQTMIDYEWTHSIKR
jgi:hypothetical protein